MRVVHVAFEAALQYKTMSEGPDGKSSPETIQHAFEVAKASVDIDGGELQMVTEKDYENVANFFGAHFFSDEPISRSVGIHMHQDISTVITAVMKQGMSIMAVSKDTGEIMCCRGIAIAQKGVDMDTSVLSYAEFLLVVNFMTGVDKQADLFNRLGVSQLFHFYGLGTNRKFRQRGLATKLMKAGLVFLKELNSDIVWVKGEGTSNFSKRIYEHNDFEVMIESKYADYVLNGKVVFDNTGDHKSENIYVKRIDK